ncbi:MAG: hypothetical protein JWO57_1390 [Pseudonocardiales bacterium]|nr:hypothetical protein [Pseudonocardiales bacterium]
MNAIELLNKNTLPDGIAGEEDVVVAGNADVVARLPVPINAFYAAYLGGDLEGMITTLHPAVTVRFPSYRPLVGIDQAREFFEFQSTVFDQMDFQLVDAFSHGLMTVVIWRETGTTASGEPWRCHGVDTLIGDGQRIIAVQVGGSSWPLRELLPRFVPGHRASTLAGGIA